jgi:hypothetical protein
MDNWTASLRLDGQPWGRIEANGPNVKLYRDQSVPRQAFDPVFNQLRTIVRTSGTTIGHLLEATRVDGSLLEGFHKVGGSRPPFVPTTPEPRAASRTRSASVLDSVLNKLKSGNKVDRFSLETMRLFNEDDQGNFQYTDWVFLNQRWVLLLWGNGYTEILANTVEVNVRGFQVIKQPSAARATEMAMEMALKMRDET